VNRAELAWLVGGLLLSVAGFLSGGRVLNSDVSTPAGSDLSSPAYAAGGASAGFSGGGFSGFDQSPALPGRTLFAGRVRSFENDILTIETAEAGERTLSLGPAASVTRIEPAGRQELSPGSTVVVRLESDLQRAAAVLVLARP
jgi:hypothetical protein